MDALAGIEASDWLTNNGPVNQALERSMTSRVFGGRGDCATVCNATTGLILALRLAASRARGRGRLVVMPSFTFAAAAHAVLWAGLEPVFCDVDPDTWLPCARSEEALLDRHGDAVAVVFPYATFGACPDLARYDRMAAARGVGVVVDAAASLGSRDADGITFGAGSRHLVVYSMHATKSFGVGEGGIVHGPREDVAAIRTMSNFGFGAERTATMPGLNAKLSEVSALAATIRLEDFEAHAQHRCDLASVYAAALPGWRTQVHGHGTRPTYQSMPVLLPSDVAPFRQAIQARMAAAGIGTGRYFSPHLREQPLFECHGDPADMPVTEALASSVLSLPMSDYMVADDVRRVCVALLEACDHSRGDAP